MGDTLMTSNVKTEHSRQAVLVFLDDQSAAGRAPRTLLNFLLRQWRVTLLSSLLATSGAVTYALLAPKWYRAQTMVAPVSQEMTSSGLGASGGQGEGLASLVGINLGGHEEEVRKQTLARLSSREFTYAFLRDETLMPILYADKWDPGRQRWKSTVEAKQPTLEKAYRYFIEHICTVSEDRRTGVIKISVDWKDPRLASEWANKLVTRINADRRADARAETERNMEFLNRELERTNIVEQREAISHLIESEMRKLMLISAHEQYAFKVIDPAFVPGREGIVSPRIAVLTSVGFLLGGALGLVVAAVLEPRIRARRTTQSEQQVRSDPQF
jgi:uncharacterized protein involved in exopolysaccharide biosynthesis